MKFRNGFVTNSSSSSFVLAFKDENDYKKFEELCDFLDYNDMKDLLVRFIDEEKPLDEQKKTAIEFVEFCMTIDDLHDWLEERIDQSLDYMKKYEKAEELKQTQEYIDYRNKLLANEKIQEKIQKIKEAEKLCQGMIWDTQGGVLEWAIRNGFLQTELYEWTVLVNNVG